MRKVVFALVALLIAAPAWADVLITCEHLGGGVIEISYIDDGNPSRVRAFALDITVSDGNIVDVDCLDDDYYIYPGSIVIVDGTLVDYGSCACDASYPGTLGGIGTSSVTIEMGSLYAANDRHHPNPPAGSGVLCRIIVDGYSDIIIDENVIRGGVVLEDPDQQASTNLPFRTGPSYPACWDYLTQCHGDADGTGDVKGSDFLILKDSWFKCYPNPTYEECADFDRDGCVKGSDFLTLKKNWFKSVPADCPPGGTWPPR